MTQTAEKKDNANYADHFTRIPNIVFVSYKHLTKEEKFLYARLRCLYWDTTPHDLSLRELADLTGYSASALSKMLPRLHNVGLIHAEIKKKQNKNGKEIGNPLYHVSINDIWEVNKRYFACSPDEQVDPSDVLLVHETIQTCSPNEQACSPNEQACSRNDTSLFTKSDKPVSFGEQVHAQKRAIKTNKILSKNKEEESVSDANASAQAHTPVSSSEKEASKPEQPSNGHRTSTVTGTSSSQTEPAAASQTCRRKPRAKKPAIDEATQKRVDAVYEAMDEFKKKVTGNPDAKYQRHQTDTDAIVKLLELNPTERKLLLVCKDMWEDKDRNGNYFWRKHMKPHNICKEYESRIMALEGKDRVEVPVSPDQPRKTLTGYKDYTPAAGTPLTPYRSLARARRLARGEAFTPEH